MFSKPISFQIVRIDYHLGMGSRSWTRDLAITLHGHDMQELYYYEYGTVSKLRLAQASFNSSKSSYCDTYFLLLIQ